MADLLDIAPTTAVEVFKINGQRIVVHGLRAPAVASIATRYPKLIGLFLGGFNIQADGGLSIIGQIGEATGPIIAAGSGHLADEKYEEYYATALLLEDQLRLLVSIIRLTFPNGLSFFVEMAATLGAGEEAKVRKLRSRKSPSPSQPSSDGASRQTMQ